MSKNSRRIIIASCTFCAAVLVSSRVIAGGDGWSGTGSDNFGGGNYQGTACGYNDGSNYYRIDCTGVSWLKYEPTEIQKREKHAVHLVPRGEGTKYGETAISEKCAGSEGFYHLGINFKAVRTVDDYFLNYTQNGGKGGFVGNLNKNFINDSEEMRQKYISYGDIGTYEFTYRLATANSWGHRYNLTESSAGNNFNTTVPENSGATMVFGHQLYKNGVKLYESETAATPRQDIPKFYAVFLNNKCSGGTTGCSEQTDGCSYSGGSWDCKNTPSNVFAFCAYPLDDPTSLSPKAKITISGHPKSPKSTSYNFSDSESTDAVQDSNIYTVNTSTIKVRGDFNFKIDKSISTTSFTPTLTVGGESVKANSLSLSGVTEIGDGLGGDDKTKTVSLEANVPKKICVSAKSPSKISSTSASGERTAEACLYVKYVPVTANIDSDTRITFDNKNYDSGADSSKIYPSTTGYVAVNPGQRTASWSYYMGWTSRSEGSGNVRAKTYGINGSQPLGNALSIGKYASVHAFNLNMISSGYPSTTGTNNTEDASVFPGESRELVQSLKHPSKVEVTSGDAADGSTDESSSVTLRIKASDIQCGLDKGQWGTITTKSYIYNIGVDNPNDYRWMKMQRTAGENPIGVIVGDKANGTSVDDDMRTNASLWLRPTDSMSVSQKACFGSQIEIDSRNKDADRWTKNLWEKEKRPFAKQATDGSKSYVSPDIYNKAFTIETTEAFKKSLVWGNHMVDSSGNYLWQEKTASWLASSGNASLWASEIGNGDNQHFHQNSNATVSTPAIRFYQGYQITAENTSHSLAGNKQFAPLGNMYTTTFKKPNGDGVSITVKVPYNYYLNLSVEGEEDSSVNILDSDESSSFIGIVESAGRKNKQVCDGTEGQTAATCNEYDTKTRQTTANMLVFAMSSDFDSSKLINRDKFSLDYDLTSKESIQNVIRGRFPGYVQEENFDLDFVTSGKPSVVDGRGIKLDSRAIDSKDFAVGTKICAAIAAYPSDSHNTGNGRDIVSGEDQSAAFNEYSGALKTAFKVSCRTVAKRQTMSVEGNGVVSTGAINSSQTNYKGRTFKSWSEYQVVAGMSGKTTVSSGAVTAYAIGYPAIRINETKDNIFEYSAPSGHFQYPQSLGNNFLNPRSADEAKANWEYSEKLINTIKKKYGEKASDSNAYIGYQGDKELTQADIGLDIKNTITIRSTGSITIKENLDVPSGSERLIIIAKNIYIDPNVTEVNAWLIVDGEGTPNAGEFNTCTGYIIDDGENYGNSHILQNCNAPLFINGPVIIKTSTRRTKKYRPIQFPRTYGGGSKLNDYGQIEKDEASFVQRAEIFNYDPSVVEWAYKESMKDPQIITTYTETLAPRL